MQHQFQFGLVIIQPLGQQRQRIDDWQAITAALLAGADGYLLPVLTLFLGAISF